MISNIKNIAKQIFRNNKMAGRRACIITTAFLLICAGVITACMMRKKIVICVDGESRSVTTYKSTVKDVIESNEIILSKDDNIEPSINSKISNNESIKVRRAMPVKVKSGHKEFEITALEGNVQTMLSENERELELHGVKFDNSIDEVSPNLDSSIEKNMEITIVQVEKKTVTENEPVNYDTVVEENPNLDESYKKVKNKGVAGEKQVTYEVVYKDGELHSKNEKSAKVLAAPISEVVVVGTAKLSASRGGANAGRVLSCSATAYSGGWGTSSGRTPRRVEGGLSTIAVDPSVIPMGSKVYVDGYGYAVAADTGTAIKGNKIDLYFNSYQESCDWGLKQVNVTIIAGPGHW